MPLERTSTSRSTASVAWTAIICAVPKISTADLAGRLRRSRDSASISPLRTDRGRRLKTRAFPALPLGVRPEDVAKSGWTAVFHRDEDVAVRTALERAHRAPARPGRKACWSRSPTIRRTPSKAGSGTSASGGEISRPRKSPYYLLIVGAPSLIPYQFAQTLDAEYCVGLLDFRDVAAYQRYAQQRPRRTRRPPRSATRKRSFTSARVIPSTMPRR